MNSRPNEPSSLSGSTDGEGGAPEMSPHSFFARARESAAGLEGPNGSFALLEPITATASLAVAARRGSKEDEAEALFRKASDLAMSVLYQTKDSAVEFDRAALVAAAVRLAFEYGAVQRARLLMHDFREFAVPDAWAVFEDISAWPEAWLIAAIRGNPPEQAALDEIAHRHWRALFARCDLLTANRHRAADLAQEAWIRVLRGRRTLRPGGNFSAYIAMVATNLFRDRHRSNLRAGPLGEFNIITLDSATASDTGESFPLVELLPDLSLIENEKRELLKEDVARALSLLNPLVREVMIARFLDGESCAEIARRLHKTEQTISSWVRRAIERLQFHLRSTPKNQRSFP